MYYYKKKKKTEIIRVLAHIPRKQSLRQGVRAESSSGR